MRQITVDNPAAAQGCHTCCCESVSIKPGETQPVQLNYAYWAVPIGFLHCDPSVSVEEKDTCAPANTGSPAITSADGKAAFTTAKNVKLTAADLKTKVTDPQATVLVFKTLPHYLPRHGTVVLTADGLFDYTPATNFVGVDRFFLSASDGENEPFIFEAMVAVGVDVATAVPSPPVLVGKPIVDSRYYTVQLPITVSPAANTCQVFRLSIRQAAMNCDCVCFYQHDCMDVKVARC